MSKHASLVYNPDASGTMASRFGDRAKLWNKHVRSFPRRAAADLVRFGGLHYAVTLDEAARRFDLSAASVAAILPELTHAEYEPHDKSAPAQTVVVLDGATVARLYQAAADASGTRAEPSRWSSEPPLSTFPHDDELA